MKYGKVMQSQTADLNADLGCLDYKRLKKLLRLAQAAGAATTDQQGVQAGEEAVVLAEVNGAGGADWRAVLFADMDRVDASFKARERLLLETWQMMMATVDEGSGAAESAEATALRRDVAELRKHAALNVVACFKIAKKHDKHPLCRESLTPLMLQHLDQKRFAAALSTSKLFASGDAPGADAALVASAQAVLGHSRSSTPPTDDYAPPDDEAMGDELFERDGLVTAPLAEAAPGGDGDSDGARSDEGSDASDAFAAWGELEGEQHDDLLANLSHSEIFELCAADFPLRWLALRTTTCDAAHCVPSPPWQTSK